MGFTLFVMETGTIRIEGMHCDGCASGVQRLLAKEAGLREADGSYPAGEARMKFHKHPVDAVSNRN